MIRIHRADIMHGVKRALEERTRHMKDSDSLAFVSDALEDLKGRLEKAKQHRRGPREIETLKAIVEQHEETIVEIEKKMKDKLAEREKDEDRLRTSELLGEYGLNLPTEFEETKGTKA